jgi:hypothetical protein
MTPTKTYNTVSKWQFPMLRLFCERAPGTFMSRSEAAILDQRSCGSLYHRGWIGERPGKGFYATKAGRAACDEYMIGEARHRQNPDLPLSHYFDPIAYGLRKPSDKSKVHVLARQGAA